MIDDNDSDSNEIKKRYVFDVEDESIGRFIQD